MKFAASILAAGLRAAACSTGSPPVVSITHVSTARVIGPAMDGLDQPSFAFRTGRPPALSLQELFHPRYNVPADPSLVRTLLVTGDIIPARGVAWAAIDVHHDYLWPFRPTADYTKHADVTYVHLDAPLFSGCPVNPNSSFTFCGDARFVGGLSLMGAKVVNLANNHLTNYGAAGVDSTVHLLDQAGILNSGLGPGAVIDVRGIKFGFIGFNAVGPAIGQAARKGGIARARAVGALAGRRFHWV